MLVKDLYLDSLLYEQSSLAHYLHHLLAEKKITLEDNLSQFDLEQADHLKVAEMIENNVLGFHKVCIYSLKMNQKDFVFIFAKNPEEAIQFYRKTFQQKPMNCHESCLDFEFIRGNDTVSFREMRKEIENFPAIAGYFKR
ncbi:hypothetical protein L1999_14135 [Neobacillus drentensis]|uniref:hypothetical protein n=1 Tax=Neobacillus drentensis TaxID=220684 RepID=UPI001F395BD6|nr:hypothetical protein [Neobacillus drentensis]ULT59588.1 hypothetical protein L1999_14135 [Neobacillus drentensis]